MRRGGAGRLWAEGLSTLRVCHSCGEAFAGQRCQAHSPCLSAPCKNAGTCHVLERGGVLDYTCSCRLGFSGPLCLTPWDNACLASPCRNGGTCDLLTLTEYKCRCPPGWSGEDRGRAAAWPCPRARGVPGFPWPAGGLWSRSSSGRLPEGPQAPPRGPCPSPSLPLGKGDTLIYAAGGAGYWSTVFKSRALQTDWAPPSHMACVLGWLLRTSVPVGRKVGFCSGAPRAEERMLSAQANAAVASGAASMTTAPLAHREDVPAG